MSLLCFWQFWKIHWKTIYTIAWPFICLIVFSRGFGEETRCLYILLLMFGYWITDCIPEAVTALIPVVALPSLQIQDSVTTCELYFKYALFVIIANFNAIAVAESGLHKRVVLFLGNKMGGSPRQLQLTLMFISLTFSMWLANAFVAQMMIPIVTQVLSRMHIVEEQKYVSKMSKVKLYENQEVNVERPTNLISLYFTIIYASAAGGLVYIGGTGCIQTFKGIYQTRFPVCSISAGYWFLLTFPISIIITVVSCIWLQLIFMELCRDKRLAEQSEYTEVKNMFQDEEIVGFMYQDMKLMKLHQKLIGIVFLIGICGWVATKVLKIKGFIAEEYFDDSIPSLIIVFVLFLLPADTRFKDSCQPDPRNRPRFRSKGLASWEVFMRTMPWGSILVIGACTSLSKAQFSTGCAKMLGDSMVFLKDLNYVIILAMVSALAFILTELVSSIVVTGVFVPAIMEMAIALKIHPILLTVPFILNCSFGIIFPSSSPNVHNVFNTMDIKYTTLLKAGFIPKFAAWSVIMIMYPIYGRLFFNERITMPIDFTNKSDCFCPPCPLKHYSVTMIIME